MNLPFNLSIPFAWVMMTTMTMKIRAPAVELAISSSLRDITHSRVSQVMVHRSVVKVLVFACTPPSPSSVGGGWCGGLWDTGS